MSEFAFALASKARRRSLLAALRSHPELTVGQLDRLVHVGEYADDLAQLTVAELLDPKLEKPALAIAVGESVEDAIMRVFQGREDTWIASSFFTRHMGLSRWVAQKALADLAARGLLERTGVTSGTRYRFVRPSPSTRLRPRRGQ